MLTTQAATQIATQILDNPVLNQIFFLDDHDQLYIRDQREAASVLLTYSVDSIEYRVTNTAMQIINMREAARLEEKIKLGEQRINELKKENSEIKDELTTRVISDDRAKLRKQEMLDGVGDIVGGILFAPVIPPMLLIGPILGLCKIFVPGSEAMRIREQEMELYKSLYPNASLTEAYTYVKEHPLKYRRASSKKLQSYLESFRRDYPDGTYADFSKYLTKHRPPTRTEIEYTDRGPTGFQFVTRQG